MAKDYLMPKLAMAMNEGTVNEWLVAEGAFVRKGQIIAAIETEKVAYDLEAPETGFLHLVVGPGTTVPCGQVIGRFAESEAELAELQRQAPQSLSSVSAPGEANQPAAPQAPNGDLSGAAPIASAARQPLGQRQPRRRKIGMASSPAARKLARERGLDLAAINGTGPGGRIVKGDVLLAARVASQQTGGASLEQIKARIPFTGSRKAIAGRMMESLSSTAQLSSFWESDVTGLMRMRDKLVARADRLGTRVSVNAFLVKALVYGVRQVPVANSRLDGGEILIFEHINLGFAVSMPGHNEYDSSLLVPVLRNVERLGLVDIDRGLKALAARVRDGSATQDDLAGSTITLSSTAGLAPPGHRTTPVLNPSNAVLFGPSTPAEKPAVVDGQVVPRTLMPLSLTFDHRILDGDPAVRLMSAIHDALENPELLLA